MRTRLLITLAAVTALAAAPAASPVDPARTFLRTAFGLSPADVERLDQGHVVGRTLPVNNPREVATLGIVRITTTPAMYVEGLLDIATFKQSDDVVQIGRFSNPPQLRDVAALTVEAGDLKQLRDCRVGDCDVRLSAEGIERVRRSVDWRTADAASSATAIVRQVLADYVARYGERGGAAAMEYADTSPGLSVGREFLSLVDADTSTWTHVPDLRRHLLDYPATPADGNASDFVYWSKERVRGRPVISITHVAIVRSANSSPIDYAIGSKQIYAMHYFDASLGVTLLVADRAAQRPATFVVYLNRSRIDLFDGFMGGVARRIVAGRARSVVEEQLTRLQRTLSARQSGG
jgi:hypothetical protein